MKTKLHQWVRRLSMTLATSAVAASCTSIGYAEPDYDTIGKQFSLIMQNGHFSRTKFEAPIYKGFIDSYLSSIDGSKLFLTQKDVTELYQKYADCFGDYVFSGESIRLAEDLYAMYSDRALKRFDKLEALVKKYEETPPTFDSDRTTLRTRRKALWAKDEAELDEIWNDQICDMLLTEQLRRDNLAKLAAEKGKDVPKNANELSPTDKILARLKRQRNMVQEADREDMVAMVLSAIAKYYDPHSDFMGARTMRLFMEQMKLSLVGIGAQLQSDDDGSTKITGIVKGGPTAKSGQLKLGDHIIAVDHTNTGEWTDIMFMGIDKVVSLIRGKKGQTVGLRVITADGAEEKVYTILREEIPMADELATAKVIQTKQKDMDGKMRDYRLGILTLPSFYMDLGGGDTHCASDVKKLLNRMSAEKVDGLVVDLRNNGGGSLDEVRKMVGFFTGSGPVVQVKDARGNIERLSITGTPIYNGELIVLINKASASASEIFAGAMADYGRAVIAGDTTTFGKGTVQMPRDIGEFLPVTAKRDGAGMVKFTTQKFYRINGSSTQLKGVSSDIVIPTASACIDMGEAKLERPLAYDEIAKAPGYKMDMRLAVIIPRLQEMSAKRIAADPDMQYMNETIARFKERTEKNSVSLNKAVRQAENDELVKRKKEMDDERVARYAKMAEQDAKELTIFRMNLEDAVNKAPLPVATEEDETGQMEREKDPEDELEESPKDPSGLDPELRECLHILRDMIDMK